MSKGEYVPFTTGPQLAQIHQSQASSALMQEQIRRSQLESKKNYEESQLAKRAGAGDINALRQLSSTNPQMAQGIIGFQKYQQERQHQQIVRGGQIAQSIELTPLDNRQAAYEKGLAQFSKEYPDEDISYFPKTYSPKELQRIILAGSQLDAKNQAEIKLKEAQAKYYSQKADLAPLEAEGNTPAAIKIANEIEKARKKGDTQRVNDIVGSAKIYDKGTVLTPEGDATNLAGYARARKELKQAESEGKKTGELETEKIYSYPKAIAGRDGAFAKNNEVVKKIDKVLPKISGLTAGFAGVPLSKIKGSEANDVRATIDSIKASIGFSELQEMRDNSPTGGALGQITEREIAFLQALMANLETSQSPEQLRTNLGEVKRQIIESKNRLAIAFQREYGGYDSKAPAFKTSTQKPLDQLSLEELKALKEGK